VFDVGGRVIRVVYRSGQANLDACLSSPVVRRFVEARRVIGAELLDDAAVAELLATCGNGELSRNVEGASFLEHEWLFESFPYEWPPEMLHATGALTLDLVEALLAEGLGLKDATPYNVLFRGPEPVFVDVLSFEPRDARNPTWLAYGQFVRTFVLPLLVNRHFALPLDQLLLARRDGLEPSEVYRLCGPLRRLRSPFLTVVSFPTWLAAWRRRSDPAIYRERRSADPERARYVLRSLLKHLRRILAAAEPRPGVPSRWSDYAMVSDTSAADYVAAKQVRVEAVFAEYRPRNVLDIGCNTGRFSILAARSGASVVAIDADPTVVGMLWREARAAGLSILPLVIDVARPSPAVGWGNAECRAFLDRARDAFDTVLMLAVVHHMLVQERIPLREVISMAARLSTATAVVEFVAPTDPLFRSLARGRDELFKELTRERFEAECRREFSIAGCHRLGEADRWLYVLRKQR
jgi:2-polyprenyl-3-methyl-5-hydroxy-6-metoxy-1,4-benzoquinol methylase